MDTFYITTPIYYVNANPHLGHAYTTILADAVNRFQRLMGKETFFLTGTDEHGEKILQASEEKGVNPGDYVEEVSKKFRDLWPDLDIEYDYFIRTTYPEHKACVQKILQQVYDNGDIYFGEYGGYYCHGCEAFYTDRELEDGKCPDHQKPLEYIQEKNYFFRMSAYQDWLIEHINSDPYFIQPENFKNEVLAMLRESLGDLCISRPKTRLTWGIELPFDSDYVTYVWFDALLNYISALGWPEDENFRKFWPSAHHVVAKDILKPHAIFWPTMLKSAGLDLYKGLRVHGYWKVEEAKMSKSLGNIVEPLAMSGKYGTSAFRYFLMREMQLGLDGSFSEQGLVNRFNADLANDLGNLFNRALAMLHKYFRGEVPAYDGDWAQEDLEMIDLGLQSFSDYIDYYQQFRVAQALEALWEFIRGLNKYIDSTAPWQLNKEGNLERLSAVMSLVFAGLRKAALGVWPVMPRAAETMFEQLGLDFNAEKFDLLRESENFVQLAAGTRVAKKSNLFPRQELVSKDSGEQEKKKGAAKENREKNSQKKQIDIKQFQELDLRIGYVVNAENVVETDKLLRLDVDVGEERYRQIVAGIAESYSPDDIQHTQVVVVCNLKPVTLKGLTSEGMILSAHQDPGLTLLSVKSGVQPGSKVG